MIKQKKSQTRLNHLRSFIRGFEPFLSDYEFHHQLYLLLQKRSLSKTIFFKRSGLSESYGYQLMNGSRRPSREKVLQTCIGLSLNRLEANQLLFLAEKSCLSHRRKKDIILLYALDKQLNLYDTNELLVEECLKPLD